MRAWSRQLGFQTPSFLGHILKGTRKPGEDMRVRLATNLKLSETEKHYFNFLLLVSNAKDDADRKMYLQLLRDLGPDPKTFEMGVEEFKVIASWYHSVLLELLELKDFSLDTSYLVKRLRNKVSPVEIQEGLDRLIRLGLLEKTEDGALRKTKGELKVNDRLKTPAIHKHHQEMSELANQALEEQAVDHTDFRGSTFAIQKKDISEAKRLIREFHKRMWRLAPKETGDEVYRFQTQFFSLTLSAKET